MSYNLPGAGRSPHRRANPIAESVLNYRHAFHAGNFADVMKHAILLQVLGRLGGRAAVTVIDTHAGAGLYDLQGELAVRSGEARSGVRRLMNSPDAPESFSPLLAAVRRCNLQREVRRYPGSPTVIVNALRPGDGYLGCELRPDDYAILADQLMRLTTTEEPGGRRVHARAVKRDGYAEAADFLRSGRPGLVVVDPPFETGGEYGLILDLVRRLQERSDVGAAIWTPLKDLETFDSFLRGLEAIGVTRAVIAQVRLRPLTDPMRMNGCAMVLIGTPDVSSQARAICTWVAATAGDEGGSGAVFGL